MSLYVWLFVAGFLASVFGSMVGLGGGFIMLPVLRLFFGLPPALAAGTSLALVIANSGSGAATYLIQRRVHVRTGWLIAAGGIPGGILGAIAVKNLSPRIFDWLFALFLVAVSVDMFFRRAKTIETRDAEQNVNAAPSMPWPRGLGVGFAVGFISSLFGVGGGVILIPSLLYFSTLSAHAISATSQFAILLTSPVGFITHLLEHDIDFRYVLPLVGGGLLGGPVGARLSLQVGSRRLLLFVGIALLIAAVALVYRDLGG